MLCFNYTVGFSWSVAVPGRPPAPRRGRGGPAAARSVTRASRPAARSPGPARPPRATPYPEVTEPCCRLPLAALPPHQRLLAPETWCGCRYGAHVPCAPFQAAPGRARDAEAPDARPGGCCEGRALGQPRGGYAGATSGRADRGRGRGTRVASAVGRRGRGRLPFRRLRGRRRALRTGSPAGRSVAAEACSPSVVCARLAATPIKIRTGGRSRGARARRSTRPPPRPTWPGASRVWVAGCSAISFPSAPIRQVSCNTLLGGFRLLWPPSCCRYRRTSFGLCARVAHRNAA